MSAYEKFTMPGRSRTFRVGNSRLMGPDILSNTGAGLLEPGVGHFHSPTQRLFKATVVPRGLILFCKVIF